MVDITHKTVTLRTAVATATITVSKEETIVAIQNRKVPKGDIFEFSRAAGLLAIKKTSDVIPDCHPLPVEYAGISYRIDGLSIIITVEVHTIYRTGVEVEAMHGASVTALVIYDMLKPLDKGLEISSIRLQEKKGGKADLQKDLPHDLKCAVIVCSDSIAAGTHHDKAGKAVMHKLNKYGITDILYEVIPDDADKIKAKAIELSGLAYDLVLFTGGTGLSPRDTTPDVIAPLLDREIPGIMETARHYGQERMPYAMLSRGVAGFIKDALVITLPGSTRGAEETMDALFPSVFHVFRVREGFKH